MGGTKGQNILMIGNKNTYLRNVKTIYQGVIIKDLLYSIPGYVYFLYLLFPFRFWEPFVFSNQTETVVITVFFACVLLLFTLPQMYGSTIFQLSSIDLCLIIYSVYLLFRFEYPIEKEHFFRAFSIICIYLYFRSFPDNYSKGLLFLLPLAGIIQIADGINRFTQPWQNISHITGIFNNTGLFGGFAALGFVVCVGMLSPSYSGKRHLKSVVLIVFGIILAKQVYASGSRASWLATLGAILFLLHRLRNKFGHKLHELHKTYSYLFVKFVAISKRRLPQYFLAAGLLVLLVFFSKYLYDLKKDSADGRILIAKVSIKMVKDAPVFGNDMTGFRAGYMNHQADYFLAHPDSPYLMNADDVQVPFNEFLKILIEQGIIGLLLFFCVLYCLFKKEIPENACSHERITIMQSVILFILIFGLFSYPFDKLPFIVLFVFSLAILSQNRNPVFSVCLFRPFAPSPFRAILSLKRHYVRIPLLLALCFVSLKIAGDAHSYAKSCRTWNRALMYFASDTEESLSQLEKLYPDLENNPVFLTTYGKTLSFGKHYREAVIVLEKAVKRQPLSASYIELGKSYEAEGFPQKALAWWKQAELMVPARFTPLYLTMKLHFKNREYEQAQECAGQLLTKKIKINNPEIGLMKREALYILNFRPPPSP